MKLAHLTLNTGRVHLPPRADTCEEAIRALDPLIKAGAGDIPACPGIRIAISRRRGRALFAFGHGTEAVAAAALYWEEGLQGAGDTQEDRMLSIFLDLAQKDIGNEPLPWLVVFLFAGIVRLPKAQLVMLGDLERCLAWALLAQEGVCE